MDKHNQFIRRLREEYDAHIHQIFGYTFDEFVNAVPGGEKKFNEDCEEAYEEGGMAALRYIIKSHIAVLDFLYFIKTEDKEWLFEDFVKRATSLGIGMREDELVPWNWTSINSEGRVIEFPANDT